MSRYKFHPSLPRKMYWSDEVGGYLLCPDCGNRLESERHTYVMATRQYSDIDLHIVGNDAGHFCSKCPVVVLDRREFEQFAVLAIQQTNNADFVVLGLVDLDAVPEEKRSLPFDDDTNPIPLVQFTNLGKKPVTGSSPRRSSKGKRKKKRR